MSATFVKFLMWIGRPSEEVKVPVSNSAEFSPKSAPVEDFEEFGVVRVNE